MKKTVTDAREVMKIIRRAKQTWHNFRAHVINGDICFSQHDFQKYQTLDFCGAEIQGNINFSNCNRCPRLKLYGTTVRGNFVLSNAKSGQFMVCYRENWENYIDIDLNGARVLGNMSLAGSEFEVLRIRGSRIQGDLNLRGFKCDKLFIKNSSVIGTIDITGLDCEDIEFENVKYGKLIHTPDQRHLFKTQRKRQQLPSGCISGQEAEQLIRQEAYRCSVDSYHIGPLRHVCSIKERIKGNVSLRGLNMSSPLDISGMDLNGNLTMPGTRFESLGLRGMSITGYVNLVGAVVDNELDLSGTSADRIYLNGASARRVSLAGVTTDLLVIKGLQAEELIFDGLKARRIIGELERWPGIEKCVVGRKNDKKKKKKANFSPSKQKKSNVVAFKPQKAAVSA